MLYLKSFTFPTDGEEFDVVIDENAIEMIETVEQAYQAIGQSEDI